MEPVHNSCLDLVSKQLAENAPIELLLNSFVIVKVCREENIPITLLSLVALRLVKFGFDCVSELLGLLELIKVLKSSEPPVITISIDFNLL